MWVIHANEELIFTIGVECTCTTGYMRLSTKMKLLGQPPLELWEDGRSEIAYIDNECEFYTTCSCCTEYSSWKVAHKGLSTNLQKLAD